jgi:hypothetical protein
MTEDTQGGKRKHQRLWLAAAVVTAILAVVVVPPLVSVSRYKASITHLISASLGRPVRLSSVEVRLLPRPGFVLNDLTVEEDPAYGAEPVLHASTVTAPIRLLSLWRGRLEIDKISVDEASLNLVRTAGGRWNLDQLLRTATTESAEAGQTRPVKLPYLEATSSRINIKNGAEKLPFSVIDADISFWQENPGEWRVRLRGQPVRTDISLNLADTGIVRLEATMHPAAQLRQMPVHLDLEWREAQLGQLTRLILGSDSGWRGDLTGELHLDGNADTAQIKTRLRASGVHREEFAPAAPLDFDANCGFVSHFSARAIDNLVCDSPLGNGHVRIAGDLPGGGQPHFSVELDRIPVAAGLDALRTVRSGMGPGLEAYGSASGKITYTPVAPDNAAQDSAKKPAHVDKAHSSKVHATVQGPLTGSITVDGLELRGNGLSQPIRIPKVVLEPSPATQTQGASLPQALTATVSLAAGGQGPLTVSTRLAVSGYQVTVRGPASIARARELAHVAGMGQVAAFDALAGEPITMDLAAEGPWMPAQRLPFGGPPPAAQASSAIPPLASADSVSGTVTLHNANWKADYLANHVQIAQATLHLENGGVRWDPVVFSYGPVKGTASLTVPAVCDGPKPCVPQFQVQFGALDAAVLQAAFLGARQPGTLLSTLLERFRPVSAPAWPQFEGTVKADSLILGPVTLREPLATVRMLANGAEITNLGGGLLGGQIHGTGTLHSAQTAQDKPSYALEGQFEKVSPAALGQLLGMHCSGGALAGGGKIELAGFSGKDLAASAKGTLHFEWQHGTVAGSSGAGTAPKALARFDRWTADGEIANGALTLKQSQVKRGSGSVPVEASVTLADPPKAAFAAPKAAPAGTKAGQAKR